MTRVDKSIRNVFWGYFEKILGMLLPFAFRTVMIYFMGAEYLGLSSLFTSVLQVLSLSELGVGTAICYSMYRPVADKNNEALCALLKLYKKVYFIIGLIIITIGFLLIPILPLLIKGDCPADINLYILYILYLFNTFFSYCPNAYCSSIFNAHQRNDLISIVSSIMLIIRFSAQILIIIVFKNYYACMVSLIISTFLQNFVYYCLSKKIYPQYVCKGNVEKDEMQKIKKNVGALLMHKIGGTVLNSADTIVISSFLGLVMVAKFSNYYYVINAVTGIVIIGFSSLTSIIGNSIIVDNKEKVTENFKRILFANAIIVGVCSAIMISVFQDFIIIWVKKKYLYSEGIMFLFVFYFYIHTIRRTIIAFRDAAGMWQDNKFQPIVSAIFNLIVNIILVQFIGIYGILISSILSMIFIDIPWESNAFCKKNLLLSSKDYIIQLLKYCILTFVICAICWLLSELIPLTGILGIIIKSIISFIIAMLVFYYMYRKNDLANYYIMLMKQLIKKKIKK